MLKIYFEEILAIIYELNLENINNKNKKDFFMIDSQISKNKYIPKKEEKLIKYEIKSEDDNKYLNQKLEVVSGFENWDQFKLNKKIIMLFRLMMRIYIRQNQIKIKSQKKIKFTLIKYINKLFEQIIKKKMYMFQKIEV